MPAEYPARDVSAAEEYYLKRAQQFLNPTAPKDVLWHFDDFVKPGYDYERVVGVGGSAGAINTREGGVIDIVTGTAASTYMLASRTAGAGGYPALMPSGSATSWYMATRLRVVTSPSADGRIGFFMRDPVSGDLDNLILGIEGKEDATLWSIYGDGGDTSVLSTTTVVNDVFVILEAYRVGTTTRLLVSEAEEGTPADVYPGGFGTIAHGGSGGTAVNAQGLFDWTACMSIGRSDI